MAELLTVNQTIDLLRNLQSAAGEFADREQKLDREFTAKLSAATHRLETLAAEEKQRCDAETSAIRARAQSAQARLRSRFDARRSKVIAIRGSSQRIALEKIGLEEGRRKYQLQKNLLEAESTRKSRRAANDAEFEVFQGELAANREEFIRLENAASSALRGFPALRRGIYHPPKASGPEETLSERDLLAWLVEHAKATERTLGRFKRLWMARLFKWLPVWLLALLLIAAHGAAAPEVRWIMIEPVTHQALGISLAGSLVVLFLVYGLARWRAARPAASIALALEQAREWHNACLDRATAHHAQNQESIESETQNRIEGFNAAWNHALEDAETRRGTWPRLIEEKADQTLGKIERALEKALAGLNRETERALAAVQPSSDLRGQGAMETHRAEKTRLESARNAQWETLELDWKRRLDPIRQTVQAVHAAARNQFRDWDLAWIESWKPPARFAGAAKFGRLAVDARQLCDRLPSDPRLSLGELAAFSMPLTLIYPALGSLLVESEKSGTGSVTGALNNILMRLLSQAPPGRFQFTIIDPVQLGQNFAGIMHLADYEENLIHGRIWTEPVEIEQRLAELNEHMEKVIQMYLRNEYETIAEYNEKAGTIAEKYHVLLVADFPVNFSETALQRLVKIAASGARCGVYTLLHWDRRQPLPPDMVLDDVRDHSVCLTSTSGGLRLAGKLLNGVAVELDPPPSPALATPFLHAVGRAGRNASRVEVPFSQVAPAEGNLWTLEAAEELRVPIGRTGATRLQYLVLGKGTRQHALIAGKTGSGKSTLFHAIITNLALWCSPDEVEFYLVDFKKGVEFKCYGSRLLPHARVVAIESDREFGLSVLQRVDEELKRRGDLFRRLGVQDVPGYKRASAGKPMPRLLLMVDEFQELFVEDDRVSQGAAVLLDRIVRQGRAFGIHVILGSQTLGGSYTLARTTIGQMGIRIALQCDEADAYLIMDDNNPTPRLLSRPGEGIYNDMAGAIEGNSPFQAVWLPDEERDQRLNEVNERARQSGRSFPGPFVFEGNAPADIRENSALTRRLESGPTDASSAALSLWLGEPNAIKGPTEAVFRRQGGANLLMVGQAEEAILAMQLAGLVALASQRAPADLRIVFLDATAPESKGHAMLRQIAGRLPHEIQIARAGAIEEILGGLCGELKRRNEDGAGVPGPSVFLFAGGLQQFRKLKREDDMDFSMTASDAESSPAVMLDQLICGGPAVGIHVIASVDTFNNVNRFLARKALGEFEMRVLFQMSAHDSASLIDNPKAGTLGLHRALLHNEHEGTLETFRPYAMPEESWLDEVTGRLRERG